MRDPKKYTVVGIKYKTGRSPGPNADTSKILSGDLETSSRAKLLLKTSKLWVCDPMKKKCVCLANPAFVS